MLSDTKVHGNHGKLEMGSCYATLEGPWKFLKESFRNPGTKDIMCLSSRKYWLVHF